MVRTPSRRVRTAVASPHDPWGHSPTECPQAARRGPAPRTGPAPPKAVPSWPRPKARNNPATYSLTLCDTRSYRRLCVVDEKTGTAGPARTDEDLLAGWKAGDDDAGDELLTRHVPALRRFSRRTSAERDDFVQETLSRVVATRDRIRSGRNFRSYLLTVARHLRSELQRRSTRGATAPQDSPPPEAPLSHTLARQQQFDLLLNALRTLSVEHRNVLDLYYWQEVSVAEMATRLGVPRGTVKSRLFTSRGLLRRALEESTEEHDVFVDEQTGFDAWIRSYGGQRKTHEVDEK